MVVLLLYHSLHTFSTACIVELGKKWNATWNLPVKPILHNIVLYINGVLHYYNVQGLEQCQACVST